MPSNPSRNLRLSTMVGVVALCASGAACSSGNHAGQHLAASPRAQAVTVTNVAGTAINLTAQRMTIALPDGSSAPMWGYCVTGATDGSCAPGSAWAPGPTIVAAAGDSLSISLTNTLPVPTSLVVLGQLGGGLGQPTTMASPNHTGQSFTTFPGNGAASPPFVPPVQGPRVRSFGTEVPGQAGTAAPPTTTLTWASLKPGTYLYETSTLPSLQVPMGLYGVLVVTAAPGQAYPGVAYDGDATLLFSEIDVAQNTAVDVAATHGTDVNLRFNDPACSPNCYPAAVNYAPTFFLINGRWFDRTAPQNSEFDVAAGPYASGNVLVRLLNAGSHTHIPAIVGLPMSLVGEDGNRAPGNPRVQNEVLLTASKTYDVLVHPPAGTGVFAGGYAPGTYPVFDRELSLSTDNRPDGGMQGFLLVNHSGAARLGSCSNTATATACVADANCAVAGSCAAGSFCSGTTSVCATDADCGGVAGSCVTGTFCAGTGAACTGDASCAPAGSCVATSTAGNPGMLPASVVARAVDDAFKVPYNTPFSGNVTANDVAVVNVARVSAPASGTLVLAANGTFTYTPNSGFIGTDSFTYNGNGGTTNTATVTLSVGSAGIGPAPTAGNDSYTSSLATRFSAPRPGVLANDTDPTGYPLTAGSATPTASNGCTSVTLAADGSFQVTGAAPFCQFTYLATNSQGTSSAPATVTVNFGAASNLQVAVVDAGSGNPIADYRWTLQEDLTFQHSVSGTPPVSTRTIGTSFHRSHMPVVATGCVGPVSCGSGQALRTDATTVNPTTGTLGARHVVTDSEAIASQTTPDQVTLDPTKRYYLSILPGDGSPPGHTMGGGQVAFAAGAWTPVTVKLEPAPLVTAQMSIYIYEDDNPTNGQDEPGENGLGGFNIILMDPAGRTGDVAGQQTYDAFNMPLSNSLLGRPGCPDELNAATNGVATSSTGNLVGAVYTCPNPPPGYTGDPAVYSLAGHALIKNLTPARYDVIAHPAAAREGAGEVWWQTETLEGTPAQDAFVGINEPIYFQEFGPPGPHVTIGFVNPGHVAGYAAANGLTGSHSITGKVTSQHMSRPSDVTLWDSGSYGLLSSTTCQVVLNSQGGNGPAVASAQCDPDGNFVLTGLPAGDYDLAIFDQWLDQIIQNVAVTVPATVATVALGNIPVLSWFTQYDQNIFQDLNGNGVYDAGEPGISNVPLTVRYRNGAPSNTTLSDSNGNGILVELFPLFNWYVAEADTTRFKQTGVHITVDGGGQPDSAGPGANLWTSTYAYAPDGSTVRTEQPGALSYGLQSFISQRNRVDWGRAPYARGENGGIVGTVVYSSTRPFDDMRFNVQTIWEPLVPRVAVNLYRKATLPDGTATLELVDSTTTSSWDDYANLVYGADGAQYLLGSDNQLRVPASGALAPAGAYPPGKQVNMQCPGQNPADPFVNYTLGAADRQRCYDGWHDWNQVQAAPYDGRYVFPSAAYVAAHPLCSATLTTGCTQPAQGQTLVSLPPGSYVVEIVPPPGYQVVKEEDKNILIGDTFIAPVTQQFGPLASIFILPDQATIANANPYNPGTGDPGFQSDPTSNLGVYGLSNATTFPECVGNLHRVPDFLSLYPQAQQVAPFAGMDRPLCDRKQVVLDDQMQASAAFFVYTEAPVASNNTGIILDDATSEFNALSPDFGEKASVPFVPVSIKDFAGLEIGRTYSDQWGAYNMMTPSSWLVNPPTPSGYGPNMLITCINDPGPIRDPATGQLVTDPSYNPSYSNFCYTNPYMPGQTTYLDTPVLPIAAFASGSNPPDCAQPDAAPVVKRVDGSAGPFGPWLPSAGGTLTITAQGDQQVPNPAYEGPFAASGTGLISQPTITRHYGFGTAKGTLRIGKVDLTASTTWGDGVLTVAVPAGTPSGELSITTAAGQASVDAVTVTIEDRAPTYVTSSMRIQDAVDAANPGDLILLDAGTYGELVIMWKPVRLQGVGAGSVIINAAKYPNSKLDAWRPRINGLFSVDPGTGNLTGVPQVDPLPTQEITGGVVLLEPTVLGSEEGAGVTVLAKNLPAGDCGIGPVSTTGHFVTESNFLCAPSRIDGVSITGGDAGGGIYVNGWAHGLEIANNRVYGNAGSFNGGIRVGVPGLELETLPTDGSGTPVGLGYDQGVTIHHNVVSKNGVVEGPLGEGGAGGGVSICAGTDGYSVDHNFICGNYSSANGGGIGHVGYSQNGTIAFNQILFNQSFQQSGATHGGGIYVGGEAPIAGTLSLGTGSLTIDANLVRGNFAEGGHGGGIRLQQVNGADVAANPNAPSKWSSVVLTNNMVVDNVAGWSGGGISLSDALVSQIVNDTVSSNDSVGIAGVVLAGGVPIPAAATAPPGAGYPTPAGISSEPTSAALQAAIGAASGLSATQRAISSPTLTNDILWQNRSFFYDGNGHLCVGNSLTDVTPGCSVLPDQATTGQCVAGARYWDLGVVGDAGAATPGASALSPTYSIITAGYAGTGNSNADPRLVNQYCNGSRVVPELPGVIDPPTVKNLQVAATVDEGNNYVNLRYGPLYTVNPATGAPFGDYHLGAPITDGFGNVIGSASPAFDTGTAAGAPNHDFDAQPRPIGAGFDKGADEFFLLSPSMSVTPVALAFGNVSLHTTVTLPVTVSNAQAATANLLLGAPTITSGNVTGRFTVANASCPIGAPGLAPGASCTLNVTFAPTALVPRPQTSTLTVNATNAPAVAVPLTGTGVVPVFVISPPLGHNFGNQLVGSPSGPFTFTLINAAASQGNLVVTGNPTLSAPLLGTSYASQFAAAFRPTNGDTCAIGTVLAPSQYCTFSVVFLPTSAGAKGTSALFAGALAGVPVASGVGLPSPVWGYGLARATAAPASLGFGNQTRGTVSAAQAVTLTNPAGNPALTGISLTFGGTNPTYFRRATGAGAGSCGATLAAGSSCTIGVVFAPPSAGAGGTTGAKSATLAIGTTSAVPAPPAVSLTGTAQ